MKLKTIMANLAAHGYKCYFSIGSDMLGRRDGYGFIVTPADNVLHVYPETFYGWGFAFLYQQSKSNGTGCSCFNNIGGVGVYEINLKIVQEAEDNGFNFACNLRAPFYRNSAQWLAQYWDKNNLEEIKAYENL